MGRACRAPKFNISRFTQDPGELSKWVALWRFFWLWSLATPKSNKTLGPRPHWFNQVISSDFKWFQVISSDFMFCSVQEMQQRNSVAFIRFLALDHFTLAACHIPCWLVIGTLFNDGLMPSTSSCDAWNPYLWIHFCWISFGFCW